MTRTDGHQFFVEPRLREWRAGHLIDDFDEGLFALLGICFLFEFPSFHRFSIGLRARIAQEASSTVFP